MYVGGNVYTTVRLEDKTKNRLDEFKEYKRESYDEVLNRLMDGEPQVKDELIAELIKDSEEYGKKPFKRNLTLIDELRKEIEGR
jgi:Mg2+/Co2+ transporter CorC